MQEYGKKIIECAANAYRAMADLMEIAKDTAVERNELLEEYAKLKEENTELRMKLSEIIAECTPESKEKKPRQRQKKRPETVKKQVKKKTSEKKKEAKKTRRNAFSLCDDDELSGMKVTVLPSVSKKYLNLPKTPMEKAIEFFENKNYAASGTENRMAFEREGCCRILALAKSVNSEVQYFVGNSYFTSIEKAFEASKA